MSKVLMGEAIGFMFLIDFLYPQVPERECPLVVFFRKRIDPYPT